ncbi:MAG: acyl carrier protein [Bacteroidetes bacterium]|nr:MAG: acyl carrier protein [Bacteroidota bacterium]
MNNQDQIKEFIQKKVGEKVSFSNADDIFKLGLVNSLFALELVVFLENSFGIQVENEDLDLNNFRSVDNMNDFVAKKTA